VPRHVIRGQPIDASKKDMARRLRSSMTPAERHLWSYLRADRFEGRQFRRQQVVNGYIADFYCHSAGLIIELDGGIHDSQREYDEERQQALELYDFHVIRFTNDQVMNNLPTMLATISATINNND
jgi:very-short-patch-repair endonuclease